MFLSAVGLHRKVRSAVVGMRLRPPPDKTLNILLRVKMTHPWMIVQAPNVGFGQSQLLFYTLVDLVCANAGFL